MKILVTGSNGQLGRSIKVQPRSTRNEWLFTDIKELDITDSDAVNAFVDTNKIDVVVNCAAYTNVERAEDDVVEARRLNAQAPAILAEAMARRGGQLIHISTDYVFGGDGVEGAHAVDAQPSPRSVYGVTKLEGERLVLDRLPNAFIIRTAWLYSEYGSNFLKTMLRLFAGSREVKVVNDQFGTPTYAADLAAAVVRIVETITGKVNCLGGIFHYTDGGSTTWYGFAQQIHRLMDNAVAPLVPCSTEEYPVKAERPRNSVLDTSRIVGEFGVEVPDWRSSLRKCMDRMRLPGFQKAIMVTGGAGFIGSHVVRRFVNEYPDYLVVNVDKLTYAGNLANLTDIENKPNYRFEKADICDFDLMTDIMMRFDIDGIIHLAAESHVDRSILDPFIFARTNVMGTLSLLQAALMQWQPKEFAGKMFYHVSTDEVYGALTATGGAFTESTPYSPHSPYSASKASSDHFVRAYHDTYGLPVVISNCSNNYGPNQFPEKLIPLFLNNIRHGRKLPVYGTGMNVRDWLYVEDHAAAIDLIYHKGESGETYNIGGHNEWSNIDLIKLLIKVADKMLGNPEGTSDSLITYVTDRAGHDLRYAIDASKLATELGWKPSLQFQEGLEKTVRWYLDNTEWIDNVTSGDYQNYYRQMYAGR